MGPQSAIQRLAELRREVGILRDVAQLDAVEQADEAQRDLQR